MRLAIKNMIQCLGVALSAVTIVVASEEVRYWLDVLHGHVGPTALVIVACALISIQEYYTYDPQGADTTMLKTAYRSAELCAGLGTLGTILPLAYAEAINLELIRHALYSTLSGLGFFMAFSFFTRYKYASLSESPTVLANENHISNQPQADLAASNPYRENTVSSADKTHPQALQECEKDTNPNKADGQGAFQQRHNQGRWDYQGQPLAEWAQISETDAYKANCRGG